MEDRLTTIIKPVVKSLGFNLVQINFNAGENNSVLQVLIENKDGSSVNVADCQKISKNLSAVLDVEDPIEAKYRLEVSSTGLDRPLTMIEDYDRFKGFLIKVELFEFVGGRKRLKGNIINRKDNVVSIKVPEGKIEIDFDNIRKAKLIVTDEMIRKILKKAKK